MAVRYTSFAEFYPYYLTQHADRMCRRAHFIGSSGALISIGMALLTRNAWWFAAAPVFGYGGAWIGHFFFEKNRPASFDQPLFSFKADWIMYFEMLSGKLSY